MLNNILIFILKYYHLKVNFKRLKELYIFSSIIFFLFKIKLLSVYLHIGYEYLNSYSYNKISLKQKKFFYSIMPFPDDILKSDYPRFFFQFFSHRNAFSNFYKSNRNCNSWLRNNLLYFKQIF